MKWTDYNGKEHDTSDNIIMDDNREAFSAIEKDMLVRHIPVPENPLIWKKEPVITKEEFKMCYLTWIIGRTL